MSSATPPLCSGTCHRLTGHTEMASDSEMRMRVTKALNEATDPIEKLRYQCLQRGACGIKGFGRAFRIMDDNSDRKLSKDELTKGSHDYGLVLSQSDIDKIFNTLDRDGSGSIDFDEFLRALRPPMNKSRLNLIDQAFKKLDKTGDGVITIDDLRGVYNVKQNPKFINGEMNEGQLFRQFLDSFDSKDKDGQITKDEFEDYYAGVSASVDSDGYFDLMMRNAWKL